jgi:hypothetical protein
MQFPQKNTKNADIDEIALILSMKDECPAGNDPGGHGISLPQNMIFKAVQRNFIAISRKHCYP